MSSFFKNFDHDALRIISYCPLCEEEFNPMEAQVLGEEGESHLLHVRCRRCEHAMLALVLVTKTGVSSVGLATDLSYNDVVKFQAGGSVSIDDVMEAHKGFESGEILRKLTNRW